MQVQEGDPAGECRAGGGESHVLIFWLAATQSDEEQQQKEQPSRIGENGKHAGRQKAEVRLVGNWNSKVSCLPTWK